MPIGWHIGLSLAMLAGAIGANNIAIAQAAASHGHIYREAANVRDEHPATDGLVTITIRFGNETLGIVEYRRPLEAIGVPLLIGANRVPSHEMRNLGDVPRDLTAERGLTCRFVHARVCEWYPLDGRT